LNKILVVEARFYDDIADQLFLGASKIVVKNGMTVEKVPVPGVFEIPAAIKTVWSANYFAGVVALGCVIRGETDHYEHICREVSRAIMDLSVLGGIPIGFGILTCENYEQAWERASIDDRDIGGRTASACLDMLKIYSQYK
jgi:6,7-dimethyl-8-ribityllumazine synthase